jgi:hypothetical protein
MAAKLGIPAWQGCENREQVAKANGLWIAIAPAGLAVKCAAVAYTCIRLPHGYPPVLLVLEHEPLGRLLTMHVLMRVSWVGAYPTRAQKSLQLSCDLVSNRLCVIGRDNLVKTDPLLRLWSCSDTARDHQEIYYNKQNYANEGVERHGLLNSSSRTDSTMMGRSDHAPTCRQTPKLSYLAQLRLDQHHF